ncbi:MAG: glycosyltransferase family 39 protein [Candidatus Moranbacteria bacterium]|nr:glycosyltransferase family 39 protein [Candidatus Moranbacteria bacterium]
MSQEKKAATNTSKLAILGLILVILIGTFLRFYHFHDWMHFELDQSRDARVVNDALFGGPGELTLLGMKAGGTSLRLGPGFYYLQYLSGLLFGATPVGMAFFIPILSVAAIGLFFLLSRRYFSEWLSLGLTSLFSVSTFLVMYGRFAWNPNPLPFFAILGFYALLRSVEPEAKHAGRWFLIAASAIGFSTHLHFLAFVALPAITLAFLLIRRPRFTAKVWLLAAGIVMLLYVPVALNEMVTGGVNSKAFISAVTNKSSKGEHSMSAKLVKDISEHGLGFLVVSTGYEGGDFFTFKNGSDGLVAECDPGCRHGWPYAIGSILIFTLGVLSLGFLWWKERNRRKADLLLLSGLWFLIPFVLYLPLSYGIAPRFFLVTAPVPFLFLGFLFETAQRLLPWKRAVIFGTVVGIMLLAASNLFFVNRRFDQLAKAPYEAVKSPSDRILKERVRVPLKLQEMIVAYLKERSEENGYPIYMWSEPEYRRALKYLLERSGVENGVFGMDGLYEEGIYLTILRSKSDLDDGTKKYLEKYDLIGTRSFGTLTMIEFRPKPEFIQARRQVFESGKVKDNPSALPRYTWSEWWNRHNDTNNDARDDDVGN